jgi:hypothetical protein
LTWTPTIPNPNYRIIVWARSAGSTVTSGQVFGVRPFPINPLPPTLISLTANKVAPQVVNTSVILTANLSGGVAPYQTKWWLHDGTSMTLLRDWATGVALTWTPTIPNPNYRIIVWARSAGSTVTSGQVFGVRAFAINPLPPTLTSLTADPSAPRIVGTPVLLMTTLVGGVAPYQTKWWLHDGTSMTLLQDWVTGVTLTWTPTAPNAAYKIIVWGRSAGSTADNGSPFLVLPIGISP